MRFSGFVRRAVRICGKLLRAIEIWGISCLFCFPALFLTIIVTLQLHSGKMAGLYFVSVLVTPASMFILLPFIRRHVDSGY